MLKSFLKSGEAEQYEGVSIEWIRGKQAIMTIYDDAKEIEQVQMYKLQTKKEMHAMMEEKGFHLQSKQEAKVEAKAKDGDVQKTKKKSEPLPEDILSKAVQRDIQEQLSSPGDTSNDRLYAFILATAALTVTVVVVLRRKRKRSKILVAR